MSSFYATMSRSFLALAIFAASVAFCGRAQAQPQEPDLKLRVDGDEGSPTGDGSDWGTSAFKFLQDAIRAAADAIANTEVETVWIWVAETDTGNPVLFQNSSYSQVTHLQARRWLVDSV